MFYHRDRSRFQLAGSDGEHVLRVENFRGQHGQGHMESKVRIQNQMQRILEVVAVGPAQMYIDNEHVVS